jgi:hypothetical protein
MNAGREDPHGPQRGRSIRTWPGLVLTITALAFAGLAVSGLVTDADSDPARPAHATITVVPGAPVSLAIPRSWLGLSTEYWSLPLFARQEAVFERVLRLLRVPGAGPLVVRIGGDSADHSFWRPHAGPLPAWAFSLTPRWTAGVSGLVRRLGLRLIVDLNLVTGSPAAAGQWAQAARSRLPAHSILGFEIGNEPDIYSHHFWTALTAAGSVDRRSLPPTLTSAAYRTAFSADARVLRRVAPGVPLLGPALARPRSDARWVTTLLAGRPRGLSAVSVHRYPYSACAHRRRAAAFPTVTRLLSPAATTGMAASLTPVLRTARRAGLPLIVTELNSVTCGGRPGVSDSFATALWAPAALFALLREGVHAADLHVRANTINAPFALGPHGLTARPLLYGLLLFVRALGPGGGLVATRVHADPALHLGAWTVRSGGRLRLVLVNAGRRAIRVRLTLPTTGPASLQRLLAASPRARSGITLNGQRLNTAGRWVGRPQAMLVAARNHGYPLLLPRHSAALVTATLGASASPVAAVRERERSEA